MKKLIALLLALVMVFALCACDSGSAPSGNGPVGGSMDLDEEAVRRLAMYEKYRGIIEALESEEYRYAMSQIVDLATAEQRNEQATALDNTLCATWYLEDAIGLAKEGVKELTITADGKVLVDGRELVWLKNHAGEEYLTGYLMDDGAYAYVLQLNLPENSYPYISLWTAEEDGDTDEYIGNFYLHVLLGELTSSWECLDSEGEVPSSVSISRDYARVYINNEEKEVEWSVVSDNGAEELTADLGGLYTATVSVRDGYPVLTVTDSSTGATGLYYYYNFGYSKSWPEYVYPRAMECLKGLLYDVENGYTVDFYSYVDDNGVYYSGNEAWEYLIDLFTSLGDYKDSAEIVSRFSVLKDMYTGAKILRTDNLGNESSNTFRYYKYDSQGRLIEGRGFDIFQLYGAYSSATLYFFYEGNEKNPSKIQYGNVTAVITPTYDAQGRMVSAVAQYNSYARNYTYTYDAAGRLATSEVWNDGNYKYKFTYTYDAQGKLVKMVEDYWYVSFSSGNESIEGRYTTTYTYDANGYLISETESFEDYLYHYKNGSYVYEYVWQSSLTYTYTNDAQGRPVSAVMTREYSPESGSSSSYASEVVEYTYKDCYFYN